VVTFFVLNILGVAATVFALLEYFVRARVRALSDLAREHRALELEQAKSERLLLNVLPEPVAARLKQDEVIADSCEKVTVLFADIVGFTPLSERLSAEQLVALLDRVFARWDALAAEHGVEKIKTIGDAIWSLAASPWLATITPRRSPSWRSRWGPSCRTWRRRPGWRCKCASVSTAGPWSPA
jgi:adenylate cyclase